MPIYSSLYNNFVRQGSAFAKSITTHSYAQSVVVAGSHLNSQNRSSFSRRNARPHFGRFHTFSLQSSSSSSAAASLHSASASTQPSYAAATLSNTFAALAENHQRVDESAQHSHGGLDAYFEALQTQLEESAVDDSEWSQYQFPKRIEWKPLSGSTVGEHDSAAGAATAPADAAAADSAVSQHGALESDLLSAHGVSISQLGNAPIRSDIGAGDTDAHLGAVDADTTQPITLDVSPAPLESRPSSEPPSSPRSTSSPPPPPPTAEGQSAQYANHLRSLSESGRYAEIPTMFEAMLAAQVRPVVASYNALLTAAVHLPGTRAEAVAKALKIFADMRGRCVSPDGDTYDMLVGLLASRSLDVSASRRRLETKRIRFGGVEEPGKFMLASHEFEHAMLREDDRLDLAVRLFDDSVSAETSAYSAETYRQLIAACARAGRIPDMVRAFEHLEAHGATPCAGVFPAMIGAFAESRDLVSAVDCYNEYKDLAVANDRGEPTLLDRQDALAYAAVVRAYVVSGKTEGARQFFDKIVEQHRDSADVKTAIVAGGFVKGFIQRGVYGQALLWAQAVEDDQARPQIMAEVAVAAADHGDAATASSAYAGLVPLSAETVAPTAALLALSVRRGDVATASRYWTVLSNPAMVADLSLVEPTAMYAAALIGSGQVVEGLRQSDAMFERIAQRLAALRRQPVVVDEVEEATRFISGFMQARGIADPRLGSLPSPVSITSSARQSVTATATATATPPTTASPYASSVAATVPSLPVDESFDPYAARTDYKGSALISDDLDGASGNSRRGPRLQDALNRFRNIRRAGRHPRYVTYSKLISAAARDGMMGLCHDILAMARLDVPLLPQYAAVRYGWSSILDAMVGACLTAGQRQLADGFHGELRDMGAAPSANTFGLYITTLKESTRTFDEASEAVRIFQRAKAEGIEPTSFLYNALIGKLGKARRIDDCLFYFGEMRGLGIRPTSVTYGTLVNALCRVSDGPFAEQLFDEMETMANYKPRPAPYNSMMQFLLTTKRDKAKVLAYYDRMRARAIAPTSHTYKLLIDTHATLEPVDLAAAEAVLGQIRAAGMRPEPVHYASLIHARGCTLHDMEGARQLFDQVVGGVDGSGSGGVLSASGTTTTATSSAVNASIFQALLEAMVANAKVGETGPILDLMRSRGIELTAYIANTLIHGWAVERQVARARAVYDAVGRERREPSTYEAMTRAYLGVEDRLGAKDVVSEMLGRGYPTAVVNKVLELLSGGETSAE